ncbi:MAG: hypothetical protein QOJ46_1438 [bacterium]|jgi:hypothetical protein|nr:hypothetical protein [Frankiaceae bacterium]
MLGELESKMAICDHNRVRVLVRVAARMQPVGVERACVEHAHLRDGAGWGHEADVEVTRA